MARAGAVYYRDKRRAEPVNDFIEALPPMGSAANAPPPEFPISSQIEGELRVRFGNTRYRVLYQRSEKLVVLARDREEHWRDRGLG